MVDSYMNHAVEHSPGENGLVTARKKNINFSKFKLKALTIKSVAIAKI